MFRLGTWRTGFVQKIATIFPGLFKDQIEFSRTTDQECNFTFPVQANRFLRLQVLALSPSLHFSVHLSFLFISCVYTRVLKCLKLLYIGIPKSMQSNLFSTPLHSKLKKTQGPFKDLKQKFKDFSRKNRIQGLFKDSL